MNIIINEASYFRRSEYEELWIKWEKKITEYRRLKLNENRLNRVIVSNDKETSDRHCLKSYNMKWRLKEELAFKLELYWMRMIC
jgi:hypothetical protein